MTQVLDRQRVASRQRPDRSAGGADALWLHGALAAAWAIAVGAASLVAISLIIWGLGSGPSATAGDAAWFGVQLWLLGHHVPLTIDGASVALPPVGLTIAAGSLLARAARLLARDRPCGDLAQAGALAAAVAVPYTLIATVLAAIARTGSIHPSVAGAFLGALLLGGTAAFVGAVRGAGLGSALWRRLPLEARLALDAAGVAGAILVGGATLLAIGSLLGHTGRIGALIGGYPGGVGKVAIVVLSLLLLPNAVVGGLGYLTGVGFAVGSGTSVAFSSTHVGALPDVPVLAAVPAHGAPAIVTVLCIGLLGAAGGGAGWRIMRTGNSLVDALRPVGLAAGAAGLGAAIVAGWAGGPAGPGRLTAVGVSPWQLGLAVAGELAIGAVAVLAGARLARRG